MTCPNRAYCFMGRSRAWPWDTPRGTTPEGRSAPDPMRTIPFIPATLPSSTLISSATGSVRPTQAGLPLYVKEHNKKKGGPLCQQACHRRAAPALTFFLPFLLPFPLTCFAWTTARQHMGGGNNNGFVCVWWMNAQMIQSQGLSLPSTIG